MSDSIADLLHQLKENYSPSLLEGLVAVGEGGGQPLYLVGGTVRDLLLGSPPKDLDIAVLGDPEEYASRLIAECRAGTLVDLSGGGEAACRAVIRGEQVDFSGFRGGAIPIEEDLQKRDFTVNAMAVEFVQLLLHQRLSLVDPCGGRQDLLKGCIRHLQGAFEDDPLRLLRCYRFYADFGFEVKAATRKEVRRLAESIMRVATERVTYELQRIFQSGRTSETLELMAADGLLVFLLPELYEGNGIEQPDFHHLDVMGHSFLALKMMEKIIENPGEYYPGQEDVFFSYLEDERLVRGLKWAALMHDIGKPGTREVQEAKNGRVTFYGHDEVGRILFKDFAKRSRWSQAEGETVSDLIGMHMHPFHLCNVQRKESLSPKAALKLTRRAGENLPGLFLLAMSDSLASEGEMKPEYMEDELARLFAAVQKMYRENIEKVVKGPKLITGNDLMSEFNLSPGPIFSRILDALDIARVEGEIVDRETALSWVRHYLEQPENRGTGE